MKPKAKGIANEQLVIWHKCILSWFNFRNPENCDFPNQCIYQFRNYPTIAILILNSLDCEKIWNVRVNTPTFFKNQSKKWPWCDGQEQDSKRVSFTRLSHRVNRIRATPMSPTILAPKKTCDSVKYLRDSNTLDTASRRPATREMLEGLCVLWLTFWRESGSYVDRSI